MHAHVSAHGLAELGLAQLVFACALGDWLAVNEHIDNCVVRAFLGAGE